MHKGSDPGGKALNAAKARRDRGERPKPADNVLLARAGEPLNPRPDQDPITPERSDAARLLALLRMAEGPLPVDELARGSGLAHEDQVRDLIDHLRSLNWWINNPRPRQFELLPARKAKAG